MMTIHELANFSGVSVRTLHYYDKINLLKPYCIEENGYRKYNDDSLRRLQQIMFYKEMDLPLKQIKEMICQPMFDQKVAIKDQMDFLIAKRNRLAKLIERLSQILEGNDTMDFRIFEHNELEEVFRSRIMQLDEYYQQEMINTYGSIDACIERLMRDEAKIKASAIQHYGSVDKYIETLKREPIPPEGMGKLQIKLDGIFKQIAALKGKNPGDAKVQKLVAEWKVTFGEITGKEDITEAFRKIYHAYMNSHEIIKWMDELFGDGSTSFVGKAMEYNDIHNK